MAFYLESLQKSTANGKWKCLNVNGCALTQDCYVFHAYPTKCGIQRETKKNKKKSYYFIYIKNNIVFQQITSRRDECAFNSLIKYETIPATKRSPYLEDDYLCLKPTFNYTLETFMSVPRRVIDETCKNGKNFFLSRNYKLRLETFLVAPESNQARPLSLYKT